MTDSTTPFDAAPYLTTAEAAAAFITDALDTDNAGHVAEALGVVARAQGMTEVAGAAGVSRAALYKGLSADGDPRLSTLLGVLRALGLSLRVAPENAEERAAPAHPSPPLPAPSSRRRSTG